MLCKRESFMSKTYCGRHIHDSAIRFKHRTQSTEQDPQGPLPSTSHGAIPLTFDHLSHLPSACQLCTKPTGRKCAPLLVGTRVAASLSQISNLSTLRIPENCRPALSKALGVKIEGSCGAEKAQWPSRDRALCHNSTPKEGRLGHGKGMLLYVFTNDYK